MRFLCLPKKVPLNSSNKLLTIKKELLGRRPPTLILKIGIAAALAATVH